VVLIQAAARIPKCRYRGETIAAIDVAVTARRVAADGILSTIEIEIITSQQTGLVGSSLRSVRLINATTESHFTEIPKQPKIGTLTY
jgi:hypothetical protein